MGWVWLSSRPRGLSPGTRVTDLVAGLVLIAAVVTPGHEHDWVRSLVVGLTGGWLVCSTLWLHDSDSGFLMDLLIGCFVVMQASGMRWTGRWLKPVPSHRAPRRSAESS